jgi:hypothetical protein
MVDSWGVGASLFSSLPENPCKPMEYFAQGFAKFITLPHYKNPLIIFLNNFVKIRGLK